VANEMFSECAPKSPEIIEDKIIAGIKRLALLSENLVIVTSEVFSDTLDYDLETVKYIRLLASVNRKLAFFADEVVEVVYGIPLRIV
jgi:adenosylcobinamide kinase/adenosylcobinamide-phosphate guanylyltransferase